jgi:mRNA-degrading endonuclease RelE of RelBE toxin-antitoxin system
MGRIHGRRILTFAPSLGFGMKKIVATPPVDIALRTLDADTVRRVHAWFDRLRNWDGDEHLRRHARSLDSVPGVYVLRTSTEIRIFFRIDDDTITILDIAKKSAILTSGHITRRA